MASLVSIIIPNFNRATLISETLQSIKDQTYQDWEAIIVDDGSTDESEGIILGFAKSDYRFKYLKRDRLPKGAQTCRNIGMEKSAGTYIIFLDSDDCLADFCLEQRLSFFERNIHLDFCVFPCLIFEKDFYDKNILANINTNENPLLRFLNQDTPWLGPSPIWKKQSLLNNNLWWDESLSTFQDYYFNISALLKGFQFKYVNAKPDVFWRRHNDISISKEKTTYKKVSSLLSICNNIATAIKSSGLLSPEFRSALASSYLDIVHRCIKAGYYKYAYLVIGQALNKSILSKSKANEIKAFILLSKRLSQKSRIVTKIINKLFYLYWGKTFYNKQFKTFAKIKYDNYSHSEN